MEILEFATVVYPKLINLVSPNGNKIEEKDFELQDYQKEFFLNLENNKFTLNQQSRQVGITTMYAIYTAYKLINSEDKTEILYISPKLYGSIHFCEFVRKIICDLYNLKPVINNKTEIKLHNNTRLKVISASPTSLCSYSSNLVIFEHINNFDEMYSVVMPNTVVNCCINISFGVFNGVLSNLWLSDNAYIKTKYHYSKCNQWTTEKIQQHKEILGLKTWDKEMECPDPQLILSTPKNVDKLLQVRVDEITYNNIGTRLLQEDISLSNYLRKLIKEDLKKLNI